MLRRARIHFASTMAIAFFAIVAFTGCYSNSYIRGAKEAPGALWMAALKGFEGPVYYVGSEGEFSYFRAGDIFWTRYKAQTSKMRLSSTFALGDGKPYRVNEGMVPEYSPK
jgi:hypothetical protein